MAKYRSLKTSLIAGEISPAALGRSDLPQFNHACKTLKNAIPTLTGGAYRRPGTFYDHNLLENDYSAPRIIPFVVSETEAYGIKIYRNIGTDTGLITPFRATTSNQVSSGGTGIGTMPDYGTSYNDGTTYDEVDDVQYYQSVDVMWLVHPNHKPHVIRRTAASTFVTAPFDNGLTGSTLRDAYPYLEQNSTAITLTPSATTGSGITLTASAALFNSSHVGALFKIYDGVTTYGCVKVTLYTSATEVKADVVLALGTMGARATWWESAWNNYRGWPRTVAIYKQRLAYGGTSNNRDSVFFSQVSNYGVMSVDSAGDPESGLTATQPFTYTLGSNSLNNIQWMSPGAVLAIGTQGEEWILEPDSGVFAADNVIANTRSSFGSAYRQAIRVGGELFTVSPSYDSIRSFVFSDEEKTYVEEPVQLLFDHYPKPEPLTKKRRIRQMAWDESRKCLWVIDTAGNLFGMVRNRKLGVTAWHRHELGGYDPDVIGSDTLGSTLHYYNLCSGSVVSMTTVPNTALGTDDVWLTVKRKIDGIWYYHIERIIGRRIQSDTAFSPGLALSGNYLADACSYEGNYVLTGSGPSEDYEYDAFHLEGETVVGTAESANGIFSLGEMTVASGVAPLNEPYPPSFDTIQYQLMIGLPYDTIIEPVRPDTGSVIGTSQGALQRTHQVSIRFHKTLAAKVGRDEDNLDTVYFREADTPMGESTELFTGTKELTIEANYERESSLTLVQDEPLPFEVTSIVYEGMVYDG